MILLATVLLATSCDGEGTRPDADPTIKIGVVVPLSGSNARYGKWIRDAIELYKDSVATRDPVFGRELEPIYEDDKTDPKTAAAATKRLIEGSGVPIVYGSWASSCVLAQAIIAEHMKTVLVAQAISPKIRDAGEYIFRSLPDARHSLRVLVPFARKQGAKRVAILYVNNDYGSDQALVFKELFEADGGTVVFNEGYEDTTSDFRPMLVKIKGLHPDALFLPGYSEVGLILKQARELAIQSAAYASDPFENPDILDVAGTAAEGTSYPFFYKPDPRNPRLRDFITRYEAKYGAAPEGTAAIAYNAIGIVIDAVRHVGTDSIRLRHYLASVGEVEGMLGPVQIDDHGDFLLPVYIKTVTDHQFTFVGSP